MLKAAWKDRSKLRDQRVFNSEFLIGGKAYDILFRQGKIRPTMVGNWLRGLIQRRGLLTREKI